MYHQPKRPANLKVTSSATIHLIRSRFKIGAKIWEIPNIIPYWGPGLLLQNHHSSDIFNYIEIMNKNDIFLLLHSYSQFRKLQISGPMVSDKST